MNIAQDSYLRQAKQLHDALAQFPQISLGHFPTPIEPMPNLRRILGGGPPLYIKRDDCTGLATGGNKTRKLEYLMGAALKQNADMIVTQGAVQSNHVRQTAAAACRQGMACHALLERRVPDAGAQYETTANILLNDLFGLTYDFYPTGLDMNAEAIKVGAAFGEQGKSPFVIPGGGSNAIGALGYAACALELMAQMQTLELSKAIIVHATGSAGTQAGLLAGLTVFDDAPPVYGISVRAPRPKQAAMVAGLAQETIDLLGFSAKIGAEDVWVDDNYVGEGYGIPAAHTLKAIELLARSEGILLDPVYSGKGFAGLLGLLEQHALADDVPVIFLHTGGSAALFAYDRYFTKNKGENS